MQEKPLLMGSHRNHLFYIFSQKVAKSTGHWSVFFLATLSIIIWLGLGFIFDFSDSWQLVINTATTIVTFLMVFIIQNSQNRENKSLQLKMDELIRVHKRAENSIIDLDCLTDEQIEELEKKFKVLSEQDRSRQK